MPTDPRFPPNFDPALTNVRVKELFPGGWLDGNKMFHFDLGEFHRFHGMPDTPESRIETEMMIREVLPQMAKEAGIEGEVTFARRTDADNPTHRTS